MLKKTIGIGSIAAVLLFIPYMIRPGTVAGEVPYYFAAVDSGFFSILLSAIGLEQFLPIAIILGIASSILLYIILKDVSKEPFLQALFWVISPIFLHTFFVPNPFSVIIPLALLGTWLYMGRLHWLSVLVFASIGLFGFLEASLCCLFLFTLKRKRSFIPAILGASLVGIMSYFYYGLPGKFLIEHASFIENNIDGLGNLLSFNIFVVILACIGLLRLWKKGDKKIHLYILILGLASIYNPLFKQMLNMFITIYAAMGIMAVAKREWSVRIIRNLSIVILILGLCYSTADHVIGISRIGPNEDTVKALEWVNQNTPADARIVSHYRNGFWIAYFGQRTPVIDASNLELEGNVTALLQTRDEDDASNMLEELGADYIFVDRKTEEMMILNNRLGLEFLMENSPDYQILLKRDDVTIWRFEKI